jgi:hypothetical protein
VRHGHYPDSFEISFFKLSICLRVPSTKSLSELCNAVSGSGLMR